MSRLLSQAAAEAEIALCHPEDGFTTLSEQLKQGM